MDKGKKTFAINILRRGMYRWYHKWTAEKRTHIGRNEYYCEECGMIGPKKSTQIDHRIPVVDPQKGFTSFDDYVDRLYCEANNLQRLCIPCHKEKSANEVSIRAENRKPSTKHTKKSKKT